jgi:hypothetical protein
MASLGRGGQWGNALIAYFALKAFAEAQAMVPEVPRWIGQDLFGALDPPITQTHPVVLYDMVSELCRDEHHPAVTNSWVESRARRLRSAGRRLVVVTDPAVFERPHPSVPATGVDLEGPYILHTRHLSRHRAHLRRLVRPVRALEACLEPAWRDLRRRGGTVIGLHVRRGDFDVKFSHQGFEFVAPMAWYRSWLAELWPRLQRPVLFVASDFLPPVLSALARYRPVTIRDLRVALPRGLRDLDLPPTHLQRDAGFFPDWYMLTRCDALAISNSTFSFTASLVNASASVFARPDPQARRLVPFDPWDSEPLLFLRPGRNLLMETLRRLDMAQRGMGPRATLPSLRRAARWYAEILLGRAIAARHYEGACGLLRELMRPQFYLSAHRRYGPSETAGAISSLTGPGDSA